MTREQELIKAFDLYCKRTKKKATTVGMWANKDGTLYDRLKGGSSCRNETYIRVMAWFEKNTPKK